MTYETYQHLIYTWMALGAVISMILLRVAAPFGRHTTSHWGPVINNRLGWMVKLGETYHQEI